MCYSRGGTDFEDARSSYAHGPQTADNSILVSDPMLASPGGEHRADYKRYSGKVSKEYVKLGTLK